MYKRVKKESVWWPVKVAVPCDGGEVHEAVFQACWALTPEDELHAFQLKNPEPIDTIVRELRGWRDINGEDDQPLSFTPVEVKAFCQLEYQRIALLNSLYEARAGAVRKN